MRGIKFRAWDKRDNRMRSVVSIQFNTDNPDQLWRVDCYPIACFEGNPHYPNQRRIEHCVLMQYTGLKDKNGKEIYEADICEFTSVVGTKHKTKIKLSWQGEVNGSYGFYYGFPLAWSEEDFGQDQLSDVEVVGNIYENPELLAEEDQ